MTSLNCALCKLRLSKRADVVSVGKGASRLLGEAQGFSAPRLPRGRGAVRGAGSCGTRRSGSRPRPASCSLLKTPVGNKLRLKGHARKLARLAF